MTHLVQHSAAGEGIELTAPDAVLTVKIDAGHTDDHYELFEVDAPRGPATPLHRTGWAKAYYVLNGRMIVQVEDEAFDLGPGSSITIPPGASHTFTVLTPTAKFLTVSLTGAMGRFRADLETTVPRAVQSRPSVHEGIFGVPAADVPAVRLWAFGVGFYNLFLACGMVVGVIAWMSGNETVGRTLVIYICMFMVLGGIVLLIADRLGLGRERGKGIGGVLARGRAAADMETTSSARRSSRPTGASCEWRRTSTETGSGRCGVAATTSVW